jgi:hypothetical protein
MIRHSKGKDKHEVSQHDREIMEKMKHLMKEFLKFRHNFSGSSKSMDELLGYSLKLTSIGLDCPTVFNFRKDLLVRLFETLRENPAELTEDEKAEHFSKIRQVVELEITYLTKMAMEDPKSYEIWFHRAWIIKTFSEQELKMNGNCATTRKFIEGDLLICEKYLKKDERNFHAWNYRLELNKILFDLFPSDKEAIIDKELKYINQKMEENFSNYSAIHFFTKYIKMKADLDPENEKSVIPKEELNHQLENNLEAIMISPNEQALWLFQRWLVENVTDLKVTAAFAGEEPYSIDIIVNKDITKEVLEKRVSVAEKENIEQEPQFTLTKKGCLKFRIVFKNLESFEKADIIFSNRGIASTLKTENGFIQLSSVQEGENTNMLQNILKNLEELTVPSLETRMFRVLNIFYLKRVLVLEQRYKSREELFSALTDLQKEFVVQAEVEKHKIPLFRKIIAKQKSAPEPTLDGLLEALRLI